MNKKMGEKKLESRSHRKDLILWMHIVRRILQLLSIARGYFARYAYFDVVDVFDGFINHFGNQNGEEALNRNGKQKHI